MSKSLTVLIADDHQLVRDGLGLLLHNAFADINLIFAEDAYCLEAQLIANIRPPDVVIVDLHMPGMDKGQQLSVLTEKYSNIPFLVVSGYSSFDVIEQAMALKNVYAFVPKSSDTSRLKIAVEYALRGEKLSPTLNTFSQTVEQSPDEVQLPPRLGEVRKLLRQGMSNKMIAANLGLSAGTVRNYLNEIYRTLKVNNRTQAAYFEVQSE